MMFKEGDDFSIIAIGLAILLSAIGVGLAVKWATADPVISACESLIEEIPKDQRLEALKSCLKVTE